MKQSKFGVGVKTSLLCGLTVLVFLGIGCMLLLRFESGLTTFFLDEYTQKIEKTLEEQKEKQRKALDSRFRVNAAIAAGLSGPFIYNMDDVGLKMALKTHMDLDEIKAIRVMDVDNEPFFAIWREKDVVTGVSLPQSVKVDELLSSRADSHVREEKVGHVEIYYTDALLAEQLRSSRERAMGEIASFRLLIEERIDNAFVYEIVGVIFIIVVLTAGIVAFLNLIIIKPVDKCVKLARQMAEGDFTGRLHITGRDEIGILGAALNNMSSNVGDMFRKVSESVTTLSSASTELSGISREMSGGVAQTSAKCGMVDSSARETSSNMNSVAAATEQVSTSVSLVARACEEIIDAVNEIAQNTEKARHITGDALGQINDASERMDELGKAADEIGKVTETIDDISDQTNLLALNATIEAARAGEAGKGFAVVAGEIKALAHQTLLATKDIKERISGIQESSSSTVEGMGRVRNVIGDVNDIVSTISTAVEEQSATTREIAGNIAQVSESIGSVNQDVSLSAQASESIAGDIAEVHQAAGEISSSSSRVNHSSEALSEMARELDTMVKKFKI